MMNLINKYCLILFCWCSCSTVSAETVMFETLGKFAQVRLPQGMCDYTNTEYGDFVRSFLSERSKSSNLAAQMPEVKVVFSECDGSTDGYPWGWIGAFKQDATGFTQNRLNQYLENNLNGIIADIDGKLDSPDSLREFEQSTGFKIGDSRTGLPIVLVSNSDVFLHSVAQEVVFEGEVLNEVIITASIVRNGRGLYIYAYELQSEASSVLQLAQSLRRMAESLTIR